MSLEEYYQWMEFYGVEPFLPDRVDIIGAQIAAMLYNVNRGKGAPYKEVGDFMLVRRSQEARRQEDDDTRETRHLQMFIASMGGTVA